MKFINPFVQAIILPPAAYLDRVEWETVLREFVASGLHVKSEPDRD
jgi:hypothetical protein